MPLAAILALATAFLEVCKVLIDKLLPEKHTPTIRRTANSGINFSGKTIEGIRAIGVKKGWIKEKT